MTKNDFSVKIMIASSFAKYVYVLKRHKPSIIKYRKYFVGLIRLGPGHLIAMTRSHETGLNPRHEFLQTYKEKKL